MKKRHIIFHDLTTEAGRKTFQAAYNAKHGLNPAPKVATKASPVVLKPLLPAERGKLGVCASTLLEAFKAIPFPGSFKLGPKQRLHRWLCDECGFWHGQAINPNEENLPPNEPGWDVLVATKPKKTK